MTNVHVLHNSRWFFSVWTSMIFFVFLQLSFFTMMPPEEGCNTESICPFFVYKDDIFLQVIPSLSVRFFSNHPDFKSIWFFIFFNQMPQSVIHLYLENMIHKPKKSSMKNNLNNFLNQNNFWYASLSSNFQSF